MGDRSQARTAKVGQTASVLAADPAFTGSYAPLPPALTSGRYYRLPNFVSLGVSTLGTDTFRCAPKFVPTSTTLSRIGAEVTSAGDAGSKYRLGIYSDDGTGRPGTLLLDAGTINGDSATVQEITISETLPRGWYWFGGVTQVVTTTQPTIRVGSILAEPAIIDYGTSIISVGAAANGFSMTGVTGALPASFTIAASVATVPAIFGKV